MTGGRVLLHIETHIETVPVSYSLPLVGAGGNQLLLRVADIIEAGLKPSILFSSSYEGGHRMVHPETKYYQLTWQGMISNVTAPVTGWRISWEYW